MGKRVIRLFAPDFAGRLDELNGRELSVILNTGVVYHGKLINLDGQSLYIQDFLRQLHCIPFSTIAEVNGDRESAY